MTKNEVDRIFKEDDSTTNTKTNMIGFGTHIPKKPNASANTEHEENRTWKGILWVFCVREGDGGVRFKKTEATPLTN